MMQDPLLSAVVVAPSANNYRLQFSGGGCCSDLQLNTNFPPALHGIITSDQWQQCMQFILNSVRVTDGERFSRVIAIVLPLVGFALCVSAFGSFGGDGPPVLFFIGMGVMLIGSICSMFMFKHINDKRMQRMRNALNQCSDYAPNLSWNYDAIVLVARGSRRTAASWITITWNAAPITIVQQPIIAYNPNNAGMNNNQPPPGYYPSAPPQQPQPNYIPATYAAPPSVDKPNMMNNTAINNANNNNNASAYGQGGGIYCNQCGTVIPAGFRFCGRCGYQIPQ